VFAAVEREHWSKFNRYRRRAEFLARGLVSRMTAAPETRPTS
jgi:hypothetical protein